VDVVAFFRKYRAWSDCFEFSFSQDRWGSFML